MNCDVVITIRSQFLRQQFRSGVENDAVLEFLVHFLQCIYHRARYLEGHDRGHINVGEQSQIQQHTRCRAGGENLLHATPIGVAVQEVERLGHGDDGELYSWSPRRKPTGGERDGLQLLVCRLFRGEDGDEEEEEGGDDAADESGLGAHGDGEDAADDEGAEIGPAGPAEGSQLAELGEEGEEVDDDDGGEGGVGDELDDVGEDVETEDDQQRGDEVVERRFGLCVRPHSHLHHRRRRGRCGRASRRAGSRRRRSRRWRRRPWRRVPGWRPACIRSAGRRSCRGRR